MNDTRGWLRPVLVQQLWLGLSLLVTWLVLSVPVSLIMGSSSLVWLAAAALLCFLPGGLVLVLQPVWRSHGAAGVGAVAGAVLRVLLVALGMVGVAVFRPGVPLKQFGLVLSVFYLVSLAVETLLIVQDLGRADVPST